MDRQGSRVDTRELRIQEGISMRTHIDQYKDEIRRAFRVLGADRGIQQNAIDTKAWRDLGFISDEEYKELRAYNRSEYSKLPLDLF